MVLERSEPLTFRVRDGSIGIKFDDELQGLGEVLISVQDVAIKTAVVTHPGHIWHQDGTGAWHQTFYKTGDHIIVSRVVGNNVSDETRVISSGVYGKFDEHGITPTAGCVILPWYQETQIGSFVLGSRTTLLRGILGNRQFLQDSDIVASSREDLPVGTTVKVSPDLPGMVITTHDVPCVPKGQNWKIAGLLDMDAEDNKDKLEYAVLICQ